LLELHVSIKDQPRRALPWRAFAGTMFLLLVASALYACWPRQADVAAFDPDSMAWLETSMWRDYYEKRYLALFRDLYVVSRDQYNFSPLDSARIAYAAASAARSFQPSRSRAEAEAALPSLVSYFRILSAGSNIKFDVEDAARTELAWWQARREAVSPDDYGLIIARVAALVYGIDGKDVRQSGLVRAQAMAYRDRRGANITEADWLVINEQLRSAYGLLKQALRAP
jgi:hypothetical protein